MLWRLELRRRIKTRAALEKHLKLSPAESRWFEETEKAEKPEKAADGKAAPVFGFLVTPYFLSRAGKEKNDPVRVQCVPDSRELARGPEELRDPLGDAAYTKVPRLVHRCRDRALLLVTDECAVNCRYCFRRHYAGGRRGPIRGSELKNAAAYLKAHHEVHELILSGGDPLTLDDERLFSLIDILREARPGLLLRLSTRIASALPSRVTRRLAQGLGLRQPLWGVIHINHPKELGPECTEALRRLVSAGVPLVSQTVLLRGVNDSEAVLEELFRALARRRVKPYYLFQADLAEGTGHFRAPLARGLEIMKGLRGRLSALALPEYALDLPGGGGKTPLSPSYIKGEEEGFVIFENSEGKEYRYPKE
ncbi:MAG: KamA family radical SAM protein [Spirochaetales bacterium]|jgi:lysine 2,3-aminomutase|nr:KamA family radical SAM protein [Spirochaetales bacterium]